MQRQWKDGENPVLLNRKGGQYLLKLFFVEKSVKNSNAVLHAFKTSRTCTATCRPTTACGTAVVLLLSSKLIVLKD